MVKKQKTASIGKNAQKLGTSRVAVGNVKWHSCRENSLAVPQKGKQRITL